MASIYNLLFILIMVPALLGYPRRKGTLLPGKRWYHKEGLPKSSFNMPPIEVYSITDPVIVKVPFTSGFGPALHPNNIRVLERSLLESSSESLLSSAISSITGNNDFPSPDDLGFSFTNDNGQLDPLNLVRILPAHARGSLPGNVLNIDIISPSGSGKIGEGSPSDGKEIVSMAVSASQIRHTQEKVTDTSLQIKKDAIQIENSIKHSTSVDSVVIPLSLQRMNKDNVIDKHNLDYYVGIPVSLAPENIAFQKATNASKVKPSMTSNGINISKASNPFGQLMDIQPFGRGPYAECRLPSRVVCGARAGWSDVIGMDDWCAGNCVVFSYSSYCDDERCQCQCTEGFNGTPPPKI